MFFWILVACLVAAVTFAITRPLLRQQQQEPDADTHGGHTRGLGDPEPVD